MRLIKRKRSPKLFRMLVLGIVGYAVFELVSQQVQIDQKKKTLDNLSDQIKIQQMKNGQLRSILDSNTESQQGYIERVARLLLDLSKKGERVFVNISGD